MASSGSEQTEETASGRNTFQEDGSGMKGGGRGTRGWPWWWGGRAVGACHFMATPMSHSTPPPPPKDVPSWLKSLRLHKYAALFSQMTYEEMMTLTEHHLESQVSQGVPSWDTPYPCPQHP